MFAPSQQQAAIFKALRTTKQHLMVKALAGTGKSTTGVEGIRSMSGRIPSNFKVTMCAFGRDAAQDLKQKIAGIPFCEAKTLHGLGFGLLRDNGYKCRGNIDGDRVKYDFTDRIGPDILGFAEKKHWPRGLLYSAAKFVGQCKNEGIMIGSWQPGQPIPATTLADLETLSIKYGSLTDEYEFSQDTFFEVTMAGLWGSKDRFQQTIAGKMNKPIDYDDMIWLPIELDLFGSRVDLLFVDEAQDLNPVQHELAFRTGKRLVFVGDPNQAIFAFRGADANSMDTIRTRLASTPEGVEELPLTVCRRCPHSVIEMAQEIVPEITALPEALRGSIRSRSGHDVIENVSKGEMILCRTNAPLVKHLYKLWKNNVPSLFRGRDLGESLLRLVDSFKVTDLAEVTNKVYDYKTRESDHILRTQKFPEALLQALEDKCDCLMAMIENEPDYESFRNRITLIASVNEKRQDPDAVVLSSIHKAKGLEAHNVSIIEPHLLPHYMSKTESSQQQERNLAYVAVTRARSNLTFADTLSSFFPRTNPVPVAPQTIPTQSSGGFRGSIGDVLTPPETGSGDDYPPFDDGGHPTTRQTSGNPVSGPHKRRQPPTKSTPKRKR